MVSVLARHHVSVGVDHECAACQRVLLEPSLTLLDLALFNVLVVDGLDDVVPEVGDLVGELDISALAASDEAVGPGLGTLAAVAEVMRLVERLVEGSQTRTARVVHVASRGYWRLALALL